MINSEITNHNENEESCLPDVLQLWGAVLQTPVHS